MRKLLFHHFPKTGGTSVGAALYKRRSTWITDWRTPELEVQRYLDHPQTPQWKLVTGHNAYLLLDVVPEDTYKVTILRDPVARVCSWYAHTLRESEDIWHSYCKGRKLRDCLTEDGPPHWRNDFSKYDLNKFHYVGTSPENLLRFLGHRGEVPKLNVCPEYPEIYDSDVEAVREANTLDLHLWHTLCKLRG